jgi:glycosyltransferase involved in cell wall biosynthesis
LKILFLSHAFYPEIGGIETISEILAHAFYEQGHEVHLLTWTKETGETKFPFNVVRDPSLLILFKEHRWADVVFENNPAIRLAWPKILFNRPSVIGLQTWISQANGSVGWHEHFKLKWLKRAGRVISCSEAIRQRCCPSSLVIGNPYQEKIFKIAADTEKSGDFIFLGRLVSDKGADLAIQAFGSLSSNKSGLLRQKLKLTIVGNGPERTRLEQIVDDLDLRENVVFTGALRGNELVQCLNNHRFLLVPSMWEEPFGIVALEGMACGCLPIVSDGGGLPDAVGKAGLVFKRGDAGSLADCMLQILQDNNLEKRLRDQAASHLSTHTSQQVSRKYLSVIESFIKPHAE